MRALIYILLFILPMTGCKGSDKIPQESHEISNIIDLTAGFENIQAVRLSEIADSVTFIPFETTSQSFMRGPKFIYFSIPYIFYFEKYFDWNGKYLGSIVKKGQGPFEEVDGGRLLYKDNHFYSKGSKFIEYDKTGKPTGKVRNLHDARERDANDFLRWGTAFTALEENFIVYEYPATLYFINRDFETVSSRKVIQTESSGSFQTYSGEKFITYYKDTILFYNFLNDTIFQVTDAGLESRWIVHFEHPLRLSTNYILNPGERMLEFRNAILGGRNWENLDHVKLADHKHRVLATYETELWVYLLMTEMIPLAELRDLTPPEPYIVYFDKKTGNTVRVKGNGFVDDLLGMDYFFPQLGIFDNKMITFIWPFELLDYVEECKSKGREVNPQLLALSKKVDAEDNPILILAHLKKKL